MACPFLHLNLAANNVQANKELTRVSKHSYGEGLTHRDLQPGPDNPHQDGATTTASDPTPKTPSPIPTSITEPYRPIPHPLPLQPSSQKTIRHPYLRPISRLKALPRPRHFDPPLWPRNQVHDALPALAARCNPRRRRNRRGRQPGAELQDRRRRCGGATASCDLGSEAAVDA